MLCHALSLAYQDAQVAQCSISFIFNSFILIQALKSLLHLHACLDKLPLQSIIPLKVQVCIHVLVYFYFFFYIHVVIQTFETEESTFHYTRLLSKQVRNTTQCLFVPILYSYSVFYKMIHILWVSLQLLNIICSEFCTAAGGLSTCRQQ